MTKGNLQVAEEENIHGRKILARQLRNNGTHGYPANRHLLEAFLFTILIQGRLQEHPKVFLKQVSLSKSLTQEGGGWEGSKAP